MKRLLLYLVCVCMLAGLIVLPAAADELPTPVLYLSFDSQSDGIVKDAAGSNDAVLKDGAALGSGKEGNALILNGSGAYAELPAGTNRLMGEAYSVCVWVKMAANDSATHILDFGGSSSHYVYLAANYPTDQGPRWTLKDNGTKKGATGAQDLLPIGEWIHLGVSAQNGTVKLYIGGVPVETASFTQNPAALGDLARCWLGRSQYDVDPYLNGAIDELRIYDRALTDAQMKTLAGAAETPDPVDAPKAHENALFVCTDVHEYNDGVSEVFRYIMDEAGVVPGGAVFGGDFVYHIVGNASQTETQRAEVQSILKQLSPSTVGYYYQGNHDSRAASGMNPTGVAAYNDYYVLYGINLDDVSSGVAELRAFLEGYYDNPNYRDKPLIIATHCPLDETRRTDHAHGTATQYIALLNEYGKAIDIVFMFGHSHTEEYENTFVPKGGAIDPENDVIGDSVTIQFTYMNMGFITNKDYAYSSGYSSAGQQHSSALKGPDYNPRRNEPGATAWELVRSNRVDSAYTTQDTVFFWDVTSGSVLTVEGDELKIDRYGYPADGTKEDHPVTHLESHTVKLGDLPEKPDHEHDYEITVTAPKCTEGGCTVGKCRICGKEIRYDETAELGHDWDDGTVTIEPTEEAPGYLTYTCRRCGETKVKKLPGIGPYIQEDIDFTRSEDLYEIIGETNARQTDAGLVLTTTRNAVEPCNGQNSGAQAETPEDLLRIELASTAPWAATLEFDFNPSAGNGYYQFFGFYCADGEDYQNMCGIRGGDGALQDFLRIDGAVTADTDGVKSSPGLASAGTYWFRIECDGDSYICSRSADGQSFTEMFRYDDTGIEGEYLLIDAYTGMTEGYTFTLKSLRFERAGDKQPDVAELVEAIARAQKLDPGKYTDESAADLAAALAEARQALSTGDQSAVDAAAAKLNAAMEALEEKHDAPFRFEDVEDAGKFYFAPVYWAFGAQPQITNGLTATTFGPDAGCTRGQVVTFLWRAAGCPEPKTTATGFTDLKEGGFYVKAVAWAVENGITNGLTATTFGPDATCTRGQIVTFLWRFRASPVPMATDSPFTDLKPNGFYRDAVAWAVANGITNGITAATFGPDATCTRGQVVTFLYRAMESK